MMKKILLFGALISMLASCGKDDSDSGNNGTGGPPTPEQKYNALLLMGSDIQNTGSALWEEARIQTLDIYDDRLNTLHMVSTPIGPLYDTDGDSIMMNFQSPPFPFMVIGNEALMVPSDVSNKVRIALKQKPLLAVTNKVSQNDTAWIIDHKVKFFMDTITPDIYIDTYMLGSSKARKYATDIAGVSMDIRMDATQKLIKNPQNPKPLESQWDKNILNEDLSNILVNKGESFYYHNQFLAKFDSTGTWGYPLGDYWPFNGEFYNGDIIGTNDTPIRHYFRKFSGEDDPTTADYVMNTELSFMSIVWVRDPMSGSFVYANSFVNSSTFKVK